jgi:hypothetical protein
MNTDSINFVMRDLGTLIPSIGIQRFFNAALINAIAMPKLPGVFKKRPVGILATDLQTPNRCTRLQNWIIACSTMTNLS